MAIPERTFGCTWQPLQAIDLPDLAGLISAIDYMDGHSSQDTLLDLAAAIDDPQRARETVLLRSEGTAVAYGWCRPLPGGTRTIEIISGCHPSWRARGLGPVLLQWQLEQAKEWDAAIRRPGQDTLQIIASSAADNQRETSLLRQAGFVPQRWTFELHLDLSGVTEPRPVAPIDGVQVIAGRDGPDDLTVAAFADGGQVGQATNQLADLGTPMGWTTDLWADPPWRQRGLLDALLATTLNRFRQLGLTSAGTSLTGDSGAVVLPYQALGYEVADALVWYLHREPDGYTGSRFSPLDQDGH